MHADQNHSVPAGRTCDPARVRYLHLVAAARAGAVRPESVQQVADIVRVTVDDEVDTSTFRAIVSDVATDVLPDAPRRDGGRVQPPGGVPDRPFDQRDRG